MQKLALQHNLADERVTAGAVHQRAAHAPIDYVENRKRKQQQATTKMGIRMRLEMIMAKPEKKPRMPQKTTVILRKKAEMRKATEKKKKATEKKKREKTTTKQEIPQPREAHEPTRPDQNRKIKVRRRQLDEQAGDANEFLLFFPCVAIYELELDTL